MYLLSGPVSLAAYRKGKRTVLLLSDSHRSTDSVCEFNIVRNVVDLYNSNKRFLFVVEMTPLTLQPVDDPTTDDYPLALVRNFVYRERPPNVIGNDIRHRSNPSSLTAPVPGTIDADLKAFVLGPVSPLLVGEVVARYAEMHRSILAGPDGVASLASRCRTDTTLALLAATMEAYAMRFGRDVLDVAFRLAVRESPELGRAARALEDARNGTARTVSEAAVFESVLSIASFFMDLYTFLLIELVEDNVVVYQGFSHNDFLERMFARTNYILTEKRSNGSFERCIALDRTLASFLESTDDGF